MSRRLKLISVPWQYDPSNLCRQSSPLPIEGNAHKIYRNCPMLAVSVDSGIVYFEGLGRLGSFEISLVWDVFLFFDFATLRGRIWNCGCLNNFYKKRWSKQDSNSLYHRWCWISDSCPVALSVGILGSSTLFLTFCLNQRILAVQVKLDLVHHLESVSDRRSPRSRSESGRLLGPISWSILGIWFQATSENQES